MSTQTDDLVEQPEQGDTFAPVDGGDSLVS